MKWFKLVFKQLQSIHIGYKRHGVIAETRLFLPGQTIWGALTKHYTVKNKKSFEETLDIFNKITCFYPMEDDIELFPSFKDGNSHFGELPEEQFRYDFTDTFVSTAIHPEYLYAKDESLHEMEIILPRSRSRKKQLYWVGLLGIDDDKNIENYLVKGTTITIGGDARYGLGLMELEKIEENKKELSQWNLSENGEFNNSKSESILRNFLEFTQTIPFKGRLELLVEFDFVNNVLPKVKNGKLYIIPGSKDIKAENKFELFRGKFCRK